MSVNLSVINPNPGNGTHGTNYIVMNASGLTTSVDVWYQNFTTPGALIPGTYSLMVAGESAANGDNIQNVSTVYADAWGNTTGQPISGPLSPGQFLAAGDYCIIRDFLVFNTSSLPDDAIIDSAHVQMVVFKDYSDTDFNVTLQNTKPPVPHDPLVAGDYFKAAFSGSGYSEGFTNTSGCAEGGYFNITLNASGINGINLTGYTRWVMRSNQDILASAPSGDEWIQFYAPSGTTPWRGPHLIINYTIPSSNWQHIVNLTFYTNESGAWTPYNTTWVQSNGTVTVPAPAFNTADTYYWNVTYESNGTNAGITQVYTFDTVATMGGGGGGGAQKRTTTYFVLGACMGTLTGGLVLNIWRKKKKQTSR